MILREILVLVAIGSLAGAGRRRRARPVRGEHRVRPSPTGPAHPRRVGRPAARDRVGCRPLPARRAARIDPNRRAARASREKSAVPPKIANPVKTRRPASDRTVPDADAGTRHSGHTNSRCSKCWCTCRNIWTSRYRCTSWPGSPRSPISLSSRVHGHGRRVGGPSRPPAASRARRDAPQVDAAAGDRDRA